MNEMFHECPAINKVILGNGFTKWLNNEYLPGEIWCNHEKGLVKSSSELYGQYPTRASEWNGTWTIQE